MKQISSNHLNHGAFWHSLCCFREILCVESVTVEINGKE